MSYVNRQVKPTIGVLAGWQFYRTATNLSYLLPVFRGINRAAQDFGCNLLLGCGMGTSASPVDPPRPAWPFSSPDVDFVPISDQNTDGLIIFTPLHSTKRSQYVQNLIAAGHPVFFIGSGEKGPTLAADNKSGIFEAIHHLVKHGHNRIAFIAGSPDDIAGDTGERLDAYRSAMEHYGLDRDPHMVAYGRHVYDGGYAAMHQIADSGVEFTAVLTSNDEMALGAMQALREAGRQIPEDVAVIGFDNRLEGAAHDPSLSSIHIPLFNMGYLAVEHLFKHIEGKTALPEILRIDTRLVARESCGCSVQTRMPEENEVGCASRSLPFEKARSQLIGSITEAVLNQAQNLGEKNCQEFSARLVDSFAESIEKNDRLYFLGSVDEVLRHTVSGEDDAHVWQTAISLIQDGFNANYEARRASVSLVRSMLDQARLGISEKLQQQHRQYVSSQRWVSSRLSLLTADLLNALDEHQIYTVIAKHLPVMGIPMAWITLFEGQESNPLAWSTARNALAPERAVMRFPSFLFPPESMFSGGQSFQLVLIPLVDPTGQMGYVVFGTEYIDLYGAIVQQLGGALNTARLYRQATEGRRLAEEANRMKSRFLSTISHELRTPLNLIVGLTGIVLRANEEGEVPLPEPTQRDMERIHTYAQHLGGLIGDVIDLATSDAGQLRLDNDFLELGQVLSIIAESGRQLASDKGLLWEVELPEEGPWVWGDRTRLRQVALNLINNAIKFTERGGVSLRLVIGDGSVTVQVSDTGLGISPDEQQVIFDEFRQSERSVALGYGGLGLGLAISKRLVEMHGGTMAVQSTGKAGEGSTISFTLPTVQPPVDRAKLKFVRPQKDQIVMVLTNQPAACERLCMQLKQRGYQLQVLPVDSPADWQSKLFDTMPEVVLLDVNIASDLGWDVLKAIKGSQTANETPVLFFKTSHDDGSVLEIDYLTKPIELAELSRALDQQWLMAAIDHPQRTILVVDDEPNTLDMHARIVQSHSSSNRVLKAVNGREALKILNQEVVDLVLLDLQMPEMDGFGVLERMRENERMRQIPVIVVTGKVLTGEDMARLNHGVATVLEKGLFSLDETVVHISSALERKRKLSGEAQRLVRLGMAFIHERYSDPISRQDIAQHVSIAEDHLTFCFRQELGTTPIEYLQRYRINQARRLLRESDRSITEIAQEVGFSDSGYFSRVFRRIAGMSPKEYRNS